MHTLATTFVDRLFGLSEGMSWSDENTVLGWRTDLPAWAWVLIVLAAFGLAGWSYHRMLGPRWARIGLTVLRAGTLIVIAALLAGPMLVLKQERVEPDCLIILVDRSASLQIKDMAVTGAQLLQSRDEALRDALLAQKGIFGRDKLGHEHRQILWLGFDATTYELGAAPVPAAEAADEDASDATSDAANAALVPQFNDPIGESTSLRTAIDQALQRVAGRPISGIVLITDGRSPEATGSDLVRRLNQQGVGVFPVPLGADTAPLDFAIAQIESPDKAFVNDIVPVNVWVEAYPQTSEVDMSQVRVRLIDEQTGTILDEQHAGVEKGEPVRLTAQSQAVGEVNWKIEIEHDGNVSAQRINELILENNSELVSIELVDRPIRVLYIEGYPRWEYRYLKSMLLREESIASSMLLLSADRAFAQEGDIPITRMPKDADEIEPYDVIILGDVPSNYFGAELMTLLRDHVAIRGAGLLWIGGPGSTPRTYETTPLADLLPMRMPGSVERLSSSSALAMLPTPVADSYNVMRLRLRGESDAEDVNATWPDSLEPLEWVQDLGPLKQIAEVLAIGRPISDIASGSAQNEEGSPLVVRMPYGAGLSLYIGTEETWRYRRGRGEYYFEQLWVQFVRMLGSNRLQHDQGPVKLAVSSRRVERDRAVVVELTVRDQALLRRNLPRIAVEVVRADDAQGEAIERIELLQDYAASDAAAGGTDEAPDASDPMTISRGRVYRALWEPSTTGSLRLRVVDSSLADLDLAETIEVFHPDDEKRQPLPDHDRLAALARDTEGQVVQLSSLADLAQPGVIPNREIRTPNDIRETLWDSYFTLLVVLLLLTVEWVGRKMIRLV